jgi:RNA polymerase sigma factor (sigma-70 family)
MYIDFGNSNQPGSMNRLLSRAKAGDRGAEEQLFQTLRARLSTITKRRVWEKEAAEDVVQQTCLTVLEKYKTEEFPAGFEAWVNGVLRMKIGNYLQSKKVSQERFEHGPTVEGISRFANVQPNPELEIRLADCMRKIVRVFPRYARVLSLSYQGYGAAEVCDRLRVTRSNLYSILSRSRSILNKCLEIGGV